MALPLLQSGGGGASGGSGTVTSVTFTGDGTVLSSTPSSAVTTTGTLTAALKTQTANQVLAGPTSGGAVNPTFRALVAADLASGIVTWDKIGSAGAALTLSNAGFATTFNHTSAVVWTWANTTIATVSTTNSSPIATLSANYWTGAASATDSWTISSALVAGSNGASTLTIAHSGSTGVAAVSVPVLITGIGTAAAPSLQIGNVTNTGLYQFGSGNSTIVFVAAGNKGFAFRGSSGTAISSNGVYAITSSSNQPDGTVDTGLSRAAAAGIAIGNGTAQDISGSITLTTVTQQSANAAQWIKGQSSELLTLSTVGLTTDTVGNLLPAGSIIEAVVCRVTTTITTTTNWAVGDATQSARFSSANATLVAGTTSIGLNQADPTVASANLGPVQVAAAKVRITCTGSNPGAGIIRITVFYRQFVAPTS